MYPTMIQVEGEVVTIVGGGKVAYRKAETFVTYGARVRVISPVFIEAFSRLEVTMIYGTYDIRHLDQSFMVVAATNSEKVNKEIGAYCRRKHILCNVVDDSALSSFMVPASLKRGDLVISISTNGKSPSLAKKIKEELSRVYDDSYEEYVMILGRIREAVLQRNLPEEEKKVILSEMILLDLEELRNYEKSYFDD